MHTYIYAYMHTYIYTYIYTYIHIYIHAYIHTYMHACIHTYQAVHQLHKVEDKQVELIVDQLLDNVEGNVRNIKGFLIRCHFKYREDRPT